MCTKRGDVHCKFPALKDLIVHGHVKAWSDLASPKNTNCHMDFMQTSLATHIKSLCCIADF